MKIPFSAYDFFGYLASGFILLAAIDYSFDGGWLLKEKHTAVVGLLWITVAYIVGHLVAQISSTLVEHILVRRVLDPPETTLLGDRKTGFWPRIFPNFYKTFPKDTQQRILSRADAVVGARLGARALFVHCHPIVIRHAVTYERLTAFLSIYGFCRNTSMALYFASMFLFATAGSVAAKYFVAIACVVAAILLFYRYLRFFRRYTQEVFRVYAELDLEIKE